MPSSTFTVFDSNHAAYVDATGSGSETISHIYENGRVTVMFCSFDTLPRIMRWFCTGRVIEWDDPRFDGTLEMMGKRRFDGARAVIFLDVWKVQTSCGTGVPLIGRPQSTEEEAENDDGASNALPIQTKVAEHFRDRDTLNHWAGIMESKGKLQPYRRDNNSSSMDGLTGMKAARRMKGQWLILEDIRAWYMRIFVGQRETLVLVYC